MDRWVNKVAVVTGASSGIGAEIVKDLARAGMIVMGLARRSDRVETLKSDLPEEKRSNLHAIKCDVTNEEEIVAVFSQIIKDFGGIDVLVNNAGIFNQSVKLTDEDNSSVIKNTIDTNILGLILCTREAFKSMKKRKYPGHIVHINSVAGHVVPIMPSEFLNYNFNVYCATKHAVTALTEGHRQEMVKEKLGIKVTSISPGVVQTEINSAYTPEALEEIPHLKAEDISSAVVYALATPPHVNVQDILIKPVDAVI
ncbi:farnesol dehydrogenase-like [Sergentomyia squamirostris]